MRPNTKPSFARLKTAFDLGTRDVEVYSDSQLVVNQVQGNFEA